MNHPTREEFNALAEEVRKIKEQATEPIRITDTILLQTLVTMAGNHATDIAVLKQTTERIDKQVSELSQNIDKRFDAIAEVQKLILARLPEKGE